MMTKDNTPQREEKKKDKPREQNEEEQSEVNQEDRISALSQDKPLIIALILITLIFGTFIFYALRSGPEETNPEMVTYNGYTFRKEGSVWAADMRIHYRNENVTRSYLLYFHYTPNEVINIPTIVDQSNQSIGPTLLLNKDKIYLTTNPEYPSEVVLGGYEVTKIAAQIFGKEVQAAMTAPVGEYPVITCDDANSTVGVIRLLIGNQTRLHHEDGCVIIEGKTSKDVVRASERLTFEMLKIL